MGDVGDGDDQPVAGRSGFGEDRVVEIARVGAVDGDQREGAQVFPPRRVGRAGGSGAGV